MSELTALPKTFPAGTTVQYRKSYSAYPADGGWTAVLALRGAAKKDFPAVASGKDFIFTLPASGNPSTSGLSAGRYQFAEIVTKAGDTPPTVKTACSGAVDVTPDVLAADAGDLQSQLEKDLVVVRAAKNKRLTKDMESYQIQGRAVVRIPFEQLVREESRILRAIAAEKRRGQFTQTVRGEFRSPS